MLRTEGSAQRGAAGVPDLEVAAVDLWIESTMDPNGRATLHVAGRLTDRSVERLEEELRRLCELGCCVDLDLSRLTFACGRGLTVLRLARAQGTSLVNCSQVLAELVEGC